MAWASADLLSRFELLARLPAVRSYPTSAQIYSLLSDANDEVYRLIASQAPHVLMGAPTQLTSADGGLTYTFGLDGDGDRVFPIGHVEVAARNGTRLLYGGTYFDGILDFVVEGDRIRIPGGRTQSFSSGPYARWVTPPETISASVQPTLKPKQARLLIVYRALEKYARIGALKDESAYTAEFDRIWTGDPANGDGGLLYALKSQFDTGTYAGNPKYFDSWWTWVDGAKAAAE